MYPVLKRKYNLLKQYGSSVIYPLIADEEALLASNEYKYEKINKTASEILELCDGTNSVDSIADILSKRYNEQYEKARSLVSGFVNEGIKKDYLYVSDKYEAVEINVTGNYETIFPFNVQFEITKACPLKCAHCFNNSGEVRCKELTTDEIGIVMDKLQDMGVKKVMLTGGEVSTRRDFIKVVEMASERFLGVSIATNGYFIDDERAKELARFKRNIVVQVSIDGAQENHNTIRGVNDSFQKATAAIKSMAENGIFVIVASTFNELNFEDMEEITKLAKELGAKQISYAMTCDIGRAKENENVIGCLDPKLIIQKGKELHDKYSDGTFFVNNDEVDDEVRINKVKSCGRGCSQICVRENGDVAPCLQFNLSYGNLKDQSVNDIFDYKRITPIINFKEPDISTCKDCEEARSCGGCVALAWDIPESICKWKRENPEVVRAFNNLKV